MKKVIQIVVSAIFIIHISPPSLFSQNNKQEKKEIYKVWVTKLDKSSKAKGYLFETHDSLVTIMSYSTLGGSQDIAVSNINEMKFRKKGKFGKGVLYGTLIGVSIGVILGYASGDDNGGIISFTAGEKATFLGIFFSLPGAIIGGIVGHRMNFNIPIRGNHNTYNAQREKLRRYKVNF